MKTSLKFAIASCLVVSVAGAAYWAGTQSADVSTTKESSPVARGDFSIPTYSLGSLSGTKRWEGDVTTEEVRFKAQIEANKEISIRGTSIYGLTLKDSSGNDVDCDLSSDTNECDTFVTTVDGPYEIIINYQLSSGYDEKGNVIPADSIESSVEFTVSDIESTPSTQNDAVVSESEVVSDDDLAFKLGQCFHVFYGFTAVANQEKLNILNRSTASMTAKQSAMAKLDSAAKVLREGASQMYQEVAVSKPGQFNTMFQRSVQQNINPAAGLPVEQYMNHVTDCGRAAENIQ
jgi:hypothetical protein